MEKIVSLASANWQYLAVIILPYFSYMIYDWTQKGMILEIYGNFLRKEHNKVIEFFKKPLGACLKCFHVWICIIFILHYGGIYFFTNIKFLLALSLSYSILVKEYYD